MKLFPSYENVQAAKRNCYPELSKMTFTETRAEAELQAMLDHLPEAGGPLLSVSASRGPVFRRYLRRYLINGEIYQDETWAQWISACDLIFDNILL